MCESLSGPATSAAQRLPVKHTQNHVTTWRGSMIPAVLAYLLIASFFAIEGFLRQGAPAKSLETTDSDKGSTILVAASLGAAVALPLLLNLLQVGQIRLSIVS